MSAYQQLEKAFASIHHLEHALTILCWDEQTMMPPGGADDRSQAVAELSALVHNRLCQPQLNSWLASAEAQTDLGPEQRANVREMKRLWQNANMMSEDFVREQSVVASRCETEWRQQRKNNDWQGFSQNFKPLVELARQQARIRQQALASATPYDALLELYSVGDGSDLITCVFDQLKTQLPELISKRRAQQNSRPRLDGPFGLEQQRQLGHEVMSFLGFNFDCGRLDESAHPFSTGNPGDQRITTRFNTSEFLEALYATIHETGHSRYEAGLPKAWRGQPAGASRSMSIHESQSLFYEKHIGGSRAFCAFVAERASAIFSLSPPLSGDDFRQAATWVEPGLIRVNADELTYPLHIVLRYEIESALINGDMEVDDIPAAWDEKMQQYLGLSTHNDYRNGCLQDVHWPSGAFGYFPSYTLGAVNAAQFRQAMEREIGPLEDIIATGDIQPIAGWLETHIWRKASLLSSQEILVQATGRSTDAQCLIDHFKIHYEL